MKEMCEPLQSLRKLTQCMYLLSNQAYAPNTKLSLKSSPEAIQFLYSSNEPDTKVTAGYKGHVDRVSRILSPSPSSRRKCCEIQQELGRLMHAREFTAEQERRIHQHFPEVVSQRDPTHHEVLLNPIPRQGLALRRKVAPVMPGVVVPVVVVILGVVVPVIPTREPAPRRAVVP